VGVVATTGGGSGGVRIEVDPEVLIRAGQRMGSLGSQLGMLSDSLGAALSSGIASGTDPAGLNFGLKYGHQAQDFADALAKAATAFDNVGYMLGATGYNYKNADAVSTIGGSGPTGGVGGVPSKTVAGHASVGPNSSMVPPPGKWYLIEPFLMVLPGIGVFAADAMTWPTGNPALMRVTAAQWRNYGNGLSAFKDDMAALKTAVSVQHIPEAGKIGEALEDLSDAVSGLSDTASKVAQSVEDFANGVQDTQDSIRRLLNRISIDGLYDTVKGFLTGDGEKVLREIAHDVGAVLNNFEQQVKGCIGLLEELTKLIGDAADAFQKWIRPILVAQFGDDVGNTLADAVTLYTDFEVGLANGIIGTVSGLVSLADVDTWKGLAQLAASVAEDPSTLPGVLENMGKQFVAWDQWSGDHPGRAAGEAAFNIGSLFVPGGALTKTGNIAKGLRFTKGLLEDGKLGQLGKLTGLAGDTKKLEELGDLGGVGNKLPDVPEFKEPNGVPDSIVNPKAPDPIDVPSNPHGLEGPSGPPEPPGSAGTPGGDHRGGGGGDGPPDPPGRSTGPSDVGPSTQPSEPSPVASQHGSEPPASTHAPSSNGEAPPAAQHGPESSSPTSPHEDSTPPPERAPTADSHEPSAPEAHGDGAPGDTPAQHPSANPSPGEHDGPGTPEHGAAPADRPHAAAGDPPNEHNRSASDGEPREHADAPASGEERREHAAANQPAMSGGGMPMAPHVGGGGHGPTESHAPTSKSSSSEPTGRAQDGKAPQAGTTERPQAQSPGASGPAPRTSPSAPVHAGPASESPHAGAESRSSRPPAGEITRPTEPPAPVDRKPPEPNRADESPSTHDPAQSDPGGSHTPADDHDAPLFDESVPGHPESYPLPPASALTPPHDGAFFWSGRDADGIGVGPESAGGSGSASRIADSHNGTTLEGLLERNGIQPPKWSPDDPAAERWWSDVSDMYAQNASGEVRAVVGAQLRPDNIWQHVELPRLMENPNVTRITEIDAGTGRETEVFNRSTHGALSPGTDAHPLESGHAPQPGDASPPATADHGPPESNGAPGDHHTPDEGSRIYSLMDDSEHETSFAPEQLADNQRVADALAAHGVSRSDMIDLINRPTDALTPAERHLVNAVRDELPAPTRDTVMQKVIPPGRFDEGGSLVQSRADDYIMENNSRTVLDRVGGSVTVADDTAHLGTPGQIHDGLRLDYADTPFAPHDPGTHIIRFQADEQAPFTYDVPRNSDMGGTSTRYDGWADPFTGNGFTKAVDDVVPEYFADNVMMREGAEMWEVLDDGSQRLAAVLVDKHWIPQGN
jgi:hypothetical protein